MRYGYSQWTKWGVLEILYACFQNMVGFGYDIVDAWAEKAPEKLAMLWTNDQEEVRRYTFADIKKYANTIENRLDDASCTMERVFLAPSTSLRASR